MVARREVVSTRLRRDRADRSRPISGGAALRRGAASAFSPAAHCTPSAWRRSRWVPTIFGLGPSPQHRQNSALGPAELEEEGLASASRRRFDRAGLAGRQAVATTQGASRRSRQAGADDLPLALRQPHLEPRPHARPVELSLPDRGLHPGTEARLRLLHHAHPPPRRTGRPPRSLTRPQEPDSHRA